MTKSREYAVVKSGRITHLLGRPAASDSEAGQSWIRSMGSDGQIEYWRRAHHGRGVVVALADAARVGDPVDVTDGVATVADGSQHPPVRHAIEFVRCDADHEYPGCDKVDWRCDCKWAGGSGNHVHTSIAQEQATEHLAAYAPAVSLPAMPPMSDSSIAEWRAAADMMAAPDDVGG